MEELAQSPASNTIASSAPWPETILTDPGVPFRLLREITLLSHIATVAFWAVIDQMTMIMSPYIYLWSDHSRQPYQHLLSIFTVTVIQIIVIIWKCTLYIRSIHCSEVWRRQGAITACHSLGKNSNNSITWTITTKITIVIEYRYCYCCNRMLVFNNSWQQYQIARKLQYWELSVASDKNMYRPN